MENNQSVRYAIAGLSAVALGALVWYMSKDDLSELDYKKYTKEILASIMKETQLEFTCIYTRNYNILLRIKESDEFEESVMDQIRTLINKEMRDKSEQICEDFCFKCHPKSHGDDSNHVKEGIEYHQFETWIEHFSEEEFMVKQMASILKLD